MPRERTKSKLLDAAGAVVRRDGPQALTLDAVAAEAGVSKGGLLYHYGTKQELIEALVARWLADFQHDIDAADPHFVRGYVRASDPAGEVADELGLLAALVADPAVLRTVRERYAIWQDRVEREGSDPVDATVARLAADGLWLAELLGMAPPRGRLREQVLTRLLELAGPGD
ncbi:TetR/AcrR family transcriptional regulator [Candidatus Solirubrobacter pratensis]|uniref:TetR/AcrR family transcriptional regulator n=1 Tax=Candidatus Solirubrobacter pratensis TaxID=1298857 RepID=UPI0003F5B9B6|nr:TetR/AcrR family transcriptional regulator [Candidatus Solirubrobacter pratensis]